MKYMLFFANSPEEFEQAPESERQRVMNEIGPWWTRHSQAGRIVGGEQLQSASTATTVRFTGDKVLVSDGPFVEAKESIGGFALVDVTDLDEALSLAKTWPARGTVEVRPIVHMDG